jgi:hypothetical protein
MEKKPYHLMTAAERTAARIAQNRASEKRVAPIQAAQKAAAAHSANRQLARAKNTFLRDVATLLSPAEMIELAEILRGDRR